MSWEVLFSFLIIVSAFYCMYVRIFFSSFLSILYIVMNNEFIGMWPITLLIFYMKQS